MGRWTACDAIVPEGGLSLYVYVADNPLSFIDPDGKQLVCPKTGCSREQAQEVEKYWGQRQEALEKEYPDLKFAREHPTATAIIEGIQVVGAVIFIVKTLNPLQVDSLHLVVSQLLDQDLHLNLQLHLHLNQPASCDDGGTGNRTINNNSERG